MSFRIRTQLVIFTLIITVLVGGAISTYALFTQRDAIYEQFETEGRAIVSLLSETLIAPLYALKVDAASQLLVAARENPYIVGTYALDQEGVVLSDGTTANAYRDEKLPAFALLHEELRSRDLVSRQQEDQLAIGSPVVTPTGELLGFVYVEFSLEPTLAHMQRETIYLAGIILGLFVLAGVLAVVLAQWFIRPIESMVTATEAIAQGNFDVRISCRRRDELARLSHSINYMAQHLRSTTVSKNYTDQIIRSMRDSLIVTDAALTIRTVNQATLDLLGCREDELIEKPLDTIVSVPKAYQSTRNALIEWVSRGEIESTYRTKDGNPIPVSLAGNVMEDDNGNFQGLVCVTRDITESKRAEGALAQAQKLESIGQLAAGIAHEINTPTQFVGDNTRFLQEAFDDLTRFMDKSAALINTAEAGPVPEALVKEAKAAMADADLDYLNAEIPTAITQSLEGIERVAKIVRAMKDFSHPGTEKRPVDLNRSIETTITVARNEWKYVAEMVTEFDPALPAVPCLASEFNQVILNLITNAAHAIADANADNHEGKGTITITTRRVDDFAEIRITDTGTGMPEEVKSRVFDHFFTTKEVGKGTGQGLSIAHGVVVKKHSGEITVDSEVGQGTTFTIRLPLTDPDELSGEVAA